jgi:MFS family permease
MGLAQLAFAFVPNYGGALVARGILGVGDALTFVSVLRFAAEHVSPRRYPMIVAMTGALGALGNIAATVPLTLALHSLGWSPTFAGAATLSLVVAALVFVLAPRDGAAQLRRRRSRQDIAAGLRRVGAGVATVWRVPGTKLGFWIHFTNTCLMATLTVLWGQPYLIEQQGFAQESASAVLTAMVVLQVMTTLTIGTVIGRRPGVRTPLGIGVGLATVASWLVLLTVVGSGAPDWLVIGVFLLSALGGPASTVGFALARDYNDVGYVGTATGIINVAGWAACVVACLIIGITLDVTGTDPVDYRHAFLLAMAIPLLGSVQSVRWWRRTRHASLAALARGESVPVHVNPTRWDLPRVDADITPPTDRTL